MHRIELPDWADQVIDKFRYRAFLPGFRDPRGQHAGIDTLVIAGTQTNCRCERSASWAFH